MPVHFFEIDKLTARFRKHRPDLCIDHGTDEAEPARQKPDAEDPHGIWQELGHGSRFGKNTGANDTAYHEGNGRDEAELSFEAGLSH